MNRKIIAFWVGSVILSFAFSGCSNVTDSQEVNLNSTSSQTIEDKNQSDVLAHVQFVEPPENGWTIEELMNVTYLYDKQLQYPLTLKDLGENFSVDDSEKVEVKDKVTVQLKYGEKNVCSVIYYQNDVKENYEDAEIFLMYFHKLYTDEPDCISVNGVTLGSSLTEVKEMLGQPDSKEIAYHYENLENGKTLVSVGYNQSDESNFVTNIHFFMKNGEQDSDLS